MSGGHFNHAQFQVDQIAEEIEHLINDNDNKEPDGYGGTLGYGYPDEVIAKFREAAHTLRRAAIMAQRIDWLVSGDDSEKTFHERWDNDLKEV